MIEVTVSGDVCEFIVQRIATSASDHIEHVRTQIPYAMLAGTAAIAGFAATGAWLALQV